MLQLDANNSLLKITATGGKPYALKNLTDAIQIERLMSKPYSGAAVQSKTLLANLPRVLTTLAGKRTKRIQQLMSLEGGDAANSTTKTKELLP